MYTYDRRSSTINNWAPTPSGLRSLLHSPCSSQNSVFVSSMSSCYFTSCNVQFTPQIVFSPRFRLFEAHTGSPCSSALSTKSTLILKQKQSHEWVCIFPWEEKSTQLQYSQILKLSKKEKNKNPCAVEAFVKACFRSFPPNGKLDECDTFWQVWTFWALRLIENYEMFHLLVTFPY